MQTKLVGFGMAVAIASACWMIASAADPALPKDQSVQKKSKQTEELAELKRAQVEICSKVFSACDAGVNAGTITDLMKLGQASRNWLEAELGVAANRDESRAAHQAHLERMRKVFSRTNILRANNAVGGAELDLQTARFFANEAEILLLEAEARRDHPGTR